MGITMRIAGYATDHDHIQEPNHTSPRPLTPTVRIVAMAETIADMNIEIKNGNTK
jgi:hypothetical protein